MQAQRESDEALHEAYEQVYEEDHHSHRAVDLAAKVSTLLITACTQACSSCTSIVYETAMKGNSVTCCATTSTSADDSLRAICTEFEL